MSEELAQTRWTQERHHRKAGAHTFATRHGSDDGKSWKVDRLWCGLGKVVMKDDRRMKKWDGEMIGVGDVMLLFMKRLGGE
jgi:hypothetical protein